MHDYVFDRCEDVHRSGARVAVLETRDLAGGLVEVEAVLVFGRDQDAILQIREVLHEAFALLTNIEGRGDR